MLLSVLCFTTCNAHEQKKAVNKLWQCLNAPLNVGYINYPVIFAFIWPNNTKERCLLVHAIITLQM